MATYDFPSSAVAVMQAIAAASDVRVSQQLERVAVDGTFLEDLTDFVVLYDSSGNRTNNRVRHTNEDIAPGVYEFTIAKELAWGADIVSPLMCFTVTRLINTGLTSPAVLLPGDLVRFRLGAYVVAAPDSDLRDSAVYNVQAYDKNYLLMSDVGDTFSVTPDGTATYASFVLSLFQMAGYTGGLASVNYPSDWAAKKVPNTIETRVWPCDDSNNFQYIDIINALLKASGCRPLYTDNAGRFTIANLVQSTTASSQWTFDRRPNAKLIYDVTEDENNTRETDYWNMPNRFIYIQSGLTFDPVEGSGQFTVNNTPNDPAHYRPGPDQVSIGRVIKSVRRLDASGQDDLVKQAEDDYRKTVASAEVFNLSTVPWPVAGHYDVFTLTDNRLPRINTRKVETVSWELPMDGSAMSWNVRTVADS